ncbi:hypothetical protein N9181_00675 [bacterium]|nr:hypothetical protein [bacterium]
MADRTKEAITTSADVVRDIRGVSYCGVSKTERSGILGIRGYSGLRFDPT